MYRFHRIERLIEREVIKIPLPEEFGEGPLWNPKPRPYQSRGKPYKKGKGKGKGGPKKKK